MVSWPVLNFSRVAPKTSAAVARTAATSSQLYRFCMKSAEKSQNAFTGHHATVAALRSGGRDTINLGRLRRPDQEPNSPCWQGENRHPSLNRPFHRGAVLGLA